MFKVLFWLDFFLQKRKSSNADTMTSVTTEPSVTAPSSRSKHKGGWCGREDSIPTVTRDVERCGRGFWEWEAETGRCGRWKWRSRLRKDDEALGVEAETSKMWSLWKWRQPRRRKIKGSRLRRWRPRRRKMVERLPGVRH
jgi:hypothetical protein